MHVGEVSGEMTVTVRAANGGLKDGGKVTALFGWIGRNVVRFRWLVVIVWLVGIAASSHFMPPLSKEVNNNNSAFLPASAPSNQAATLAKPLIGSVNNSQVEVVASATTGRISATQVGELKGVIGRLDKVPTVISARFLGLSSDQKAAQLLVVSSVYQTDQTRAEKLVNNLQRAISSPTAGLHLNLAGAVATNVANQKKSNKQSNEIQFASILFILVLLFLIFRALLAPIITLLGPIFALALSDRLIGELGAHGLQISFFTQILIIVLLLGAGTDYGLFLVFRVREELHGGKSVHEAVAHSMARVGESISASAATVIVALLSLLFATFGIYHSLGVPLAIGVGVMLVAGLTLLPALLAIFGRAVFWPTSTAKREHRDGLWGRVAGSLLRRPVVALVIGVVVFGALSAATFGFHAGSFGGQQNAPAGTAIAKGNDELLSHFKGSSTNPTTVVMDFSKSVWTDPSELQAATAALNETHQFSHISGPLNPNGTHISASALSDAHRILGESAKALAVSAPVEIVEGVAAPKVKPALYEAYVATARYISASGHTVAWQTSLVAGNPTKTAALDDVPTLRAGVSHAAKSAGASASGVAGVAPALFDISTISGADLRHIIPIAVLAIGLVLALVLRSAIAPIYLIVSVVLSYLASLGISVLVFINIAGNKGIVFLLPFLMFIFLLALGEDYNILVMTRIREEASRRPLKDAVIRAVGTTGPTITAAGLVLAGSFAVLAVVGGGGTGGTQIREIGLGLAVGILLDTFLVRTVLVPAAVTIFGRWNWWPSKLGVATDAEEE